MEPSRLTFTAEAEHVGERLDRFLTSQIPDHSRSQIQRLIEDGRVTHSRYAKVKANNDIREGDVIGVARIAAIQAAKKTADLIPLCHPLMLSRVAVAAVVTRLMGGGRNEIINAVSNAWIDGQAIRTYRHAPNTGSRKSWAAGDATSRGVKLAMMALQGEMGYPSALTAKTWGFYDVLFKGEAFKFQRP